MHDDLQDVLYEIEKDKEDALYLIALEAKRIDDMMWEYRRERSMGADYDRPKMQESDLQNLELRDKLRDYFNKKYLFDKKYEFK